MAGARPFASDARARRLHQALKLGMIVPITIESRLQAPISREGFQGIPACGSLAVIDDVVRLRGGHPVTRIRRGPRNGDEIHYAGAI
jgi:hypothetical protein